MPFLRWLLPSCMAVLIVAVGGAYWYLNPARLRAIVEPRLSSALGREVTFDRIEWGLLDGVVISGLRVGTSLAAERAQAHVSPRAWWSGDGWWGELLLEGVEVTAAGRDRKDAEDSRLEARDEGDGSRKAVLLPIDRVRIREGTLRVENYPPGRGTVASGISGRVRALQGNGTLALDSDLAVARVRSWAEGDTLTLRDLQVAGQVTLGERSLPLFGSMEGSVRAADGTWQGFALHQLEMAFRTEDGRLRIGPIRGQVCEGALKGALVWDKGAWEGFVSLLHARAERVLQSAGWQIPVQGAVDIATEIADGAVAGGSVKMAEGRVVKWDILQRNLRPLERLGLLTADDVPLRDVAVVFRMQGDAVILDGSRFAAADMAFAVRGSGTLAGQLSYVFDVSVPTSRIKYAGLHVGRAWDTFFGRKSTIPVQVRVEGTTRAPKVTVKRR